MTGKTSPVRRKRRPQRSNSLKDIGRLLGVAGTAHDAETRPATGRSARRWN